jgi:predicted transcriptional regulator of viral defense system
MKSKPALTKIRTLLKSASFTSSDARKLGVSAANLAYYVNSGDLQRIGHGIYRGTEAAPSTEDFRWEDLADAAMKTRGGVVCLTSALALYDLTEEVPRQHWIAIDHRTRRRSDKLTKIVRMRNLSLGKTEFDLGGVSIPVFDRERTIVDSFRYLSIETAIKALRTALNSKRDNKINLIKLKKYAKVLRVRIDPYILAVST